MGDDSLILREDGYIRMNFPVTSLTYHSNLNIILVKTDVGGVHVLDVNSGVILQSSCLSADDGGTLGVEYAAGADRVFVWDSSGVGARTDYNGVLLLHTALQRPLPSSQPDRIIRIEVVLSEAVLLYQCLQSLDAHSVEGLSDFITELKNSIDSEPVRKGVKAQKWSTVTICLPQSIVRLVTTGVVQELKGQNRRIPALAIASAVGQRANELVPCSRDEDARPLMYSEAERKETFKRWPHMDYKWALPARMAQAGFYHQPTPSGDDRAMCFTCLVCLVCWEKSDEPWVEHERHSPNCPFVRGEYTHNVPISVTNATACAVPSPNVTIVSKGNSGELIATGTPEGKVNVWRFDCGLKLAKFIHLSPYDSIFSGILCTDCNKVWSTSLEKDSSTYGIELTAMSFVRMTSQQETYPQAQNTENIEKETNINKTKPSLICAVTITRTNSAPSNQPIKEDSSKALFDSGVDKSKGSVQAMNDQNEAKSNLAPTNKMLFLLTYDIHSSLAGSVTTVVHTSNSSGNSKPGGSKKVCTVARKDEANIYDEIYFQYSDEDTELPQCTNSLIDEQISNVINLNASSSKDDCKMWEPKKIIFTKHFKVLPPPPPKALMPELPESGQGSMLDFVGKISQLKSWKSGNLESVGTKLADQTDAVLQQADPITHYLNMNGPLEISDLKWYEGGDGTEKVKVTTFGGTKVKAQSAISNSNNDGFDSDPPQEEVVSQGVAIQCLSLPANLNLIDDSKVSHLLPTEDKEHLLVVISSIEPEKVKVDLDLDHDGDTKMDVDEVVDHTDKDHSESKAYFLLFKINNKTSVYTLEDNPVSVKELPYNESPVDLCLLPIDKHDQYSFAAVGVDGSLRLYSLPDFRMLSEKRVPKGQFTSVTFCASVERLSVSTKLGMIYFYALNNGEKDSTGDIDEDEFANIDFDMLQKAPRDEVSGPTSAPVIIANKTELDVNDLETLISLTGSYGTNTTVPYSAVVPGFWCELSPAQRSRSDHQNNRTWRLQSSTWDEHVLELTLPYSVSLAHVEFGFTLHSLCSVGVPMIQITLLKQNLHGLGYKKDASFGHRSDSPVHFSIDADNATTLENPVNSEEYLQAHNAEILAGPMLLSSGIDLTQQSGTLILTSPRLYRARGRTFLIHIKSLFDPTKDMGKGKCGESGKKSGFVGCDWLHQISLTVRASPPTDIPMERQQRIAMLESNSFLNTLCEISANGGDMERKKLALDLLIWTISIRLQRMRTAKSDKGKSKDSTNPVEAQQLECVRIIERHTDALIKNCILCSNRSIAKKCVKIMLITSESVKQLLKPWKSTFDQTLMSSVSACIPYLGACESPGALRWLVALAQHASQRGAAGPLVAGCLALLERTARCLRDRADVYHQLLRARFGLYGLPLERTIFAAEVPELGRGSSTAVTYASVLGGDSTTPPTAKTDCQLKDLLNFPPDIDSKAPPAPVASWAQNNGVGVFGAGLSEAMPLHVTCHVASDGTKLESTGARHHPAVVSSMPGGFGAADPSQLWSVMKEGHLKQTSQDPDSLEDVESSLMECDPQEKLEFSEEKLFKDQEQCNIPWAALVSRPPQHTLVVERMHSGARRYIVLDFGHTVRLSDVIIPSCSDLVTLCIDIWVVGEETDCVKLAFATDIATKHLVLTDIQPPPLCRYMKITTIGRYGMSAMKCKIPLGWFYGEVAEIANVQSSINALNALHQDLACRFRLATGKLMDLLNPYLELYNGNAAHMMAYLNMTNDTDVNVFSAYQECIELQQQLHTCTNTLKKLQNGADCNPHIMDMMNKGKITSEALLERASTDKLTVISENIVDMLLYFFFQCDMSHEEVSVDWCRAVCPVSWEWGGRSGAALATLVARLCGPARWWGPYLADTLAGALADPDAPPLALDRCMVLVMYMCRKSLFAQAEPEQGVAAALAERALSLVRSPRPQPALTAAVLTALAAVLDAAAAASAPALPAPKHNRWDWVTGGRVGSGNSETSSSSYPRAIECRLHRRKVHRKLLHQMQELEAARRGIQVVLEEQQRARFSLKARMAMVGKRSDGGGKSEPPAAAAVCRPMPAALGSALAHALVAHMLAADCSTDADALLLQAKVVGRLCAVCGGAGLLDPASILGLARLAVTLPPWPRHALTTLLQDLVEFESGSNTSSPPASSAEEPWSAAGSSRYPATSSHKPARPKGATVADALADSFGLAKSSNFSKPQIVPQDSIKDIDLEEQLTQVTESDDSDTEEKVEQYFLDAVKKEIRKPVIDNSVSVVSVCCDARVESGAGGAGCAAEALARRALLGTGGALAAALRAPTPPPPPASTPPSAQVQARSHPPLTHTLYDVFRHLALEFHYQIECTFMENVVALWLTLNGSVWGGGAWSLASLAVPADMPRVRLASDTTTALLHALCTLENISLRCWVLSMQALAWIASLPLQDGQFQLEGSTQTMGRVILECEHFVPAVVKFITMNVNTDGAVTSSEPYLGGASIGAGAGAASALHSVLSRVVCARGAAGALAALRMVASVWRRDSDPGHAYDLQATLLRLALPMLQLLTARHTHHAVALLDTVAHLSASWVRESSGGQSGPSASGGSEARVSGLLADVLGGAGVSTGGGGATGAGGSGGAGGRRAPLRRAVLAQLLYYCRKLLAAPLPLHAHASASSPSVSSGEQSQTDESKAQQQEATNVEDERKQQAARAPCHADTILQHPLIMQRFYRTLSMCDGMRNYVLNSSIVSECGADNVSLKEEIFWLVAAIPNVAANPALMVSSLMDFLRKEEVVHLSQAMQQLIIRLLDKPEALAAFIEAGGLELAVEKLTACHQSGPSNSQGLVSSLMNYLKLPPQLVNLSTPGGSKKNQPPVIEAANGLVNIAPLCTVSCGNPTAQAADVLLEGGAGSGGRSSCATRRVRAAAWSYHFFSADDTSLALTLTLPYAAMLHEVQLQPHLTSLATCPGAVGVEAGCGGTVAPLGPPQTTAGMTYIRLGVSRPVVCNTVQLRLYRPRDSANMGLLQLRLLVAPAFSGHLAPPPRAPLANNWAWVISACTRARLSASRWNCLTSSAAVSALCACIVCGAGATHAHHALLAAAQHAPALRPRLVHALLQLDAHAHAHEFQVSSGNKKGAHSMSGVCALVRVVCLRAAAGSCAAYLQWLQEAARARAAPSAALTHTLATVLWSLKEEKTLDNLEELITDELFELIYSWIEDVPESSLLKKSLDAILCSMCYIRPELFKRLLEHMNIPVDQEESMEGLTDDTKVHAGPGRAQCHDSGVAWRARGWQLQSVAAAAMSPAATLALLHSALPPAAVAALTGTSAAHYQRPAAAGPGRAQCHDSGVAWRARGWQLQSVAAAAMSPAATLALLHSALPPAAVAALTGTSAAHYQRPAAAGPGRAQCHDSGVAWRARGWQLQSVAAAAMSPAATLALLHSALPPAAVAALTGTSAAHYQRPAAAGPGRAQCHDSGVAWRARGWQLQSVAAAAMSPAATLALLHSALPPAAVAALTGTSAAHYQRPAAAGPGRAQCHDSGVAWRARGWQLHSALPPAAVAALTGTSAAHYQRPAAAGPGRAQCHDSGVAWRARGWQLQSVAAAAMSPAATLALLHSALPPAAVAALTGTSAAHYQRPAAAGPGRAQCHDSGVAWRARGWQLQSVAAAAMSPAATLALLHSALPPAAVAALTGTSAAHYQRPAAAGPGRAQCHDSGVAWRARGWQLQSVAAAAMSPAATLALLHSALPPAAVAALTDFSEAKLEIIKAQLSSQEDVTMVDSEKESAQTKTDLPSLKSVCQLVEFLRSLCSDRRLKDWLGTAGSCFWRPLLTLLCYPRPPDSTWEEGAQYAQLEENTIRLFAELNVCHAENQKLFAHTLHKILESLHCTGPEGISGFTRALILRLVLSGERVRVAVGWAAPRVLRHHAHPPHPSARAHHTLSLPLCTTVRQLLVDHSPPLPMMEEAKVCGSGPPPGTAPGVVRSASDTAIMSVASAWGLTLAAASASKDKRVKDVKNTSLKHQASKKRQAKPNEPSLLTVAGDLLDTSTRVQVAGIEGFVPSDVTLGQLARAAPHNTGPHLTLTLHLNPDGEAWSGPTWDPSSVPGMDAASHCNDGVVREFGACGGLALVAARLPRPHAAPAHPPHAPHPHHDLDWVKLDDPYEEVAELGVSSASSALGGGGPAEEGGVPAHALAALGLLLKLPRYAAALLDEGARAVCLLRLLLGVTSDDQGRNIVVSGSGSGEGEWSLGTLPFRVVSRLLESAGELASAEAKTLRRALLALGAVKLVLACLAVFTHHRPASSDNSQASNGSSAGKSEEKSQLYWAKGTGFGTGSTQQSWNVEQALVRQRTEEEHVTVLLQVLASYMNPGEKWPPEENATEEEQSSCSKAGGLPADGEDSDSEPHELGTEFIELVAGSSLVPAICSYLRNDSVLDMSRHIPLYVCVLKCARALLALRSQRLAAALRPLPRLLHQMSRTTNSYAAKLRMSKKNIFGKMTYSQRFSTSSNSELSEEDEGLAALIADIQATSALVCRAESEAGGAGAAEGGARLLSGATREARYIDLMRTMQFETFEMIAECPDSGFRFTVPYHFEGAVRAAGARAAPARMKRLAQEAATLATSLPLSYSSSVFVRTDTDRLDVMKVLITGPSDTPYANGCFILDVYFPAEYPAVPMLINLETTGRHSVRFNPNLYNDGKVCLSVLNTWHGRPEEKWNAHTSSFLQVLVSIQSLILVPEPYFNEPGYERSRGTSAGTSASLEYNSNIYQACARWAMLDHLRAPEPCFKEVIQTHFWIKRNEIMQTVANWITELEGQNGDERTQRSLQLNLMALKRHYVKLQEELAKLPVPAGLEELDEPFRLPAAPEPAPAAAAAAALDRDMEKIVSHVLD